MSMPIDTNFAGYPATWLYLDRHAGTLSAKPGTAAFATSDVVRISIAPRFLNAPPQAQGFQPQQQFLGQGKPAAYVKTQLEQIEAGTSTKPLSYGAMYSIIDMPNNDIKTTFFSDPDSEPPIENVPIPGGRAKFRTPISAIVGGTKPKSSLLNILTQVVGLAGSPAAKALFPIAGAELTLAENVESLVANVATSFAPQTKQQFWINNEPITVVASASAAASADEDALELRTGTTHFAVFPTGDGDHLEQAVQAIARPSGLTFDLGHDGELIAFKDGVAMETSPFDPFIYITYKATVAAS